MVWRLVPRCLPMDELSPSPVYIDELASALAVDLDVELAGRRPVVFLDYDGTLTPIVAHPGDALLPDATRRALQRLADRHPVAIVSGRDRIDVEGMVASPGLYYAGSHGFDISGPEGFEEQRGFDYQESLLAASDELEGLVSDIPGAWVERKRYAVAVHSRQAGPDAEAVIEERARSVAAGHPDLRVSGGKKITELRPDIEWDKGRAVLWLLESLGFSDEGFLPFYLGDDETDEDVFRVFQGKEGVGIVVGHEHRPTLADYALADPDEVSHFMERLAEVEAR